nr:hypothetical protein [Tanacetum cinerariifolium]
MVVVNVNKKDLHEIAIEKHLNEQLGLMDHDSWQLSLLWMLRHVVRIALRNNTSDHMKLYLLFGCDEPGYKYHPRHVISYPLDQIRTDLSYVEEPEAILDRQDRVMRKKTIPFVKILWRNHPEREATWETEESIRTSYPHFLP